MGKINKLKRFICVLMSALVLMSNVAGTALRTVYAAELGVLFGQMALDSILTNLMISTGVNYLGYDSAASFKAANGVDAYTSLSNYFKSKTFASQHPGLSIIANALDSIKTAKETYEDAYVNGAFSYTCEYGYSLVGNDNGGISIKLNSELIKACRDAVKLWADSDENEFTSAWVDTSIPASVSGTYPKKITYKTHSFPDFGSIDKIDDFYRSKGVADFIKSKGFSDDNASVFCYSINGVSFDFVIVPFAASLYNVNGYHRMFANDVFSDMLSYAGYQQDCKAFLCNSECMDLSEYCFSYDSNGGGITSLSSFPVFNGGSSLTRFISFNRVNAINEGSFVRYFSGSSTSLYVFEYSLDISGKALTYNPAKAPSIPDELTYTIPEDVAVNGFTDTDLAALMTYIQSLSEQLKDLEEDQIQNQEEIIQQNKNILEAINAIHTSIHTSSSNVGKIAATVIALPDLFKELFSTFPSAAMVNELITGLPALVAEEIYSVSIYPAAERMEALVGTIPVAIAKELVTVFPKADEIADAVIALPGSIGKALEGVAITIPDIKIPDITIPDIKIPEIVIPKIDAPSVTLNPAITVQNDYAGLADAIGLQVEGVLTKVFVPSEALTLEKVAHINSYFAFVGQIRDTIDVLLNKLLGITPVPYLKIPLGKESSEYDYGFGEYFIIDCSWYADYKSFGDKIILAICWATFLWKIFMKLPGIISGTEGSIGEADHSYKKYIDSINKKNNGK